jgi:hypothetical protein
MVLDVGAVQRDDVRLAQVLREEAADLHDEPVAVHLKVANRWGLDSSCLRLHHDYPTEEQCKTLAGTVAGFIGASNGVIAVLWLAAARSTICLLFT